MIEPKMRRTQRIAALTDLVIDGVAHTAGHESANGSGYVFDYAERIGADEEEVKEACDAAERAIRRFLRKRKTERAAMQTRRNRLEG